LNGYGAAEQMIVKLPAAVLASYKAVAELEAAYAGAERPMGAASARSARSSL
jgi:hypothetical protein